MSLSNIEKNKTDVSKIGKPEQIRGNPEVSPEEKNKLNTKRVMPNVNLNPQKNYHMNSEKTLDNISKKMNPENRKIFNNEMKSGENPRVKLIPRGAEMYRTGSAKKGSFLTEDYPGKTKAERKENLQLPPENKAGRVHQLKATRPQIGVESTIKEQPKWAKESGYQARPGMKQIYIPNSHPKEGGALAEGRFEKSNQNQNDRRR